MGLWTTGYLEFHEPSDLEAIPLLPVPPPRYKCPDCNGEFTDPRLLNEHRFLEHPTRAPVLSLNGRILDDRPVHITRPIVADNIDLRNVTTCSVNGVSMPVREVSTRIAQERNQTLDIVIWNGFVSKTHQFIVSIADPTHIQAVDKAFIDSAFNGPLTSNAIARFRAATDRFTTAKRYQHGICQYLYGVLAKDRSPDSGLRHDAYLEKYNDATEALKDFETPLSKVVIATIAFHQNRFNTAHALVPSLRLGQCAERFDRVLDGEALTFGDFASIPTDDVFSSLLIDSDTERVVTNGARSAQHAAEAADDLVKMYETCSNGLDKIKFAFLAVEALNIRGDADSIRNAGEICKRYRHDVHVGHWAESRRRG